jgi:probable F420-dependent oxidoreductase
MSVVEETRTRLGSVGVWLASAPLDPPPAVELRAITRLDRLGYGSVWSGEGVGSREAFAMNGMLLASTERIVLGSGIANVWARGPRTMQGGGNSLASAFPGRFVLGVGIGHAFQAAKVGEEFRPLPQMREYLSIMDTAVGENPPRTEFPRVLAAIGPKMLELSRDAADGAHPFFAPVEHTAFAREILGPDKLLVPHQTVLLEPDPARARAIARETVRMVLTKGAPAYARAWRRFGYSGDIDAVTDRLIDAAVAWGSEEDIVKRIRAQLDAGADHVLISPIGPELDSIVDQLERLAPAVLEVSK